MILIEITAAIDAVGTLQTFYVGSDSFVTGLTDTPASIAFEPCIVDPGSIALHIFSDGRTGGSTKLEMGEIVLTNADGALDGWINYSFDSRPVTIRSGNAGAAYPAGFSTIFVGTIEAAEASWAKFTFRLRDKQWRLQLPALTTRYAGTNALPAGLEGTPTDIAGQVKPKAYGKVFNVAPPMVNTSKLAYEVGICNSIDNVYDSGNAVTFGSNYATSALLLAAATGAGTYDTCLAEGYFRLGTKATGLITANVTQGAAAGNRTVAQVLKQLALDAGFSAGEISSADVTALDGLASQVIGVWLFDETTFQQIMDVVAASVGAWYCFDSSGLLRMGQLLAPTGTPVVTLQDFDTLNGFERRPPKDEGIPVWRVVLGHSKIWSVQTSGLAGAVTAATQAYLASQYRYVVADDTSIKTQWLLAGSMTAQSKDATTAVDNSTLTLLTLASDATTEAARRLAMYKVRRDLFDVPVSLDFIAASTLKFGDVVAIQVSRFGMTGSRSFRLIGISLKLNSDSAVLTLWG